MSCDALGAPPWRARAGAAACHDLASQTVSAVLAGISCAHHLVHGPPRKSSVAAAVSTSRMIIRPAGMWQECSSRSGPRSSLRSTGRSPIHKYTHLQVDASCEEAAVPGQASGSSILAVRAWPRWAQSTRVPCSRAEHPMAGTRCRASLGGPLTLASPSTATSSLQMRWGLDQDPTPATSSPLHKFRGLKVPAWKPQGFRV